MAGGVIEKDHGWNALKRALQGLEHGDAYVKAGVIGDPAAKVEEEHQHGQQTVTWKSSDGQTIEGRPAGEPLTNVKLAVIHEFGAPAAGIPERSFIRASFDTNRGTYIERLRRLVKGVYEGKGTVKKALELLGFAMKWDMKNFIRRDQVKPPDSEATLERKRRKGNSASAAPKTLVDSAKLVGAIDHAVVLEGGGAVQLEGSAYGTKGEG